MREAEETDVVNRIPALDDYAKRVLSERARLALCSPQDEPAAPAPLSEDEAWRIIETLADR